MAHFGHQHIFIAVALYPTQTIALRSLVHCAAMHEDLSDKTTVSLHVSRRFQVLVAATPYLVSGIHRELG